MDGLYLAQHCQDCNARVHSLMVVPLPTSLGCDLSVNVGGPNFKQKMEVGVDGIKIPLL